MGAAELLLDVLLERVCPADGIVFASGLLVEMALALDVGVLKAVGPRADLPRTRFRQRDELCNRRSEISDFRG
jgi:hypothetical protein